MEEAERKGEEGLIIRRKKRDRFEAEAAIITAESGNKSNNVRKPNKRIYDLFSFDFSLQHFLVRGRGKYGKMCLSLRCIS